MTCVPPTDNIAADPRSFVVEITTVSPIDPAAPADNSSNAEFMFSQLTAAGALEFSCSAPVHVLLSSFASGATSQSKRRNGEQSLPIGCIDLFGF